MCPVLPSEKQPGLCQPLPGALFTELVKEVRADGGGQSLSLSGQHTGVCMLCALGYMCLPLTALSALPGQGRAAQDSASEGDMAISGSGSLPTVAGA